MVQENHSRRGRQPQWDERVIDLVALLINGNESGAEIRRILEAQFKGVLPESELPSTRTIQRWIEQQPQPGSESNHASLDETFQWHKLDDYGLSWESGEFLLEVWR